MLALRVRVKVKAIIPLCFQACMLSLCKHEVSIH